MRTDKALLEWEGSTLLAHALKVLRNVTPIVSIVGNREKFGTFGPVIEDVFLDRGPLGGIHSALRSSGSELNLVLAVDMPHVSPLPLSYLADCARSTSAWVTIPRADGRLQPLCAIYRREFAAHAERSLKQGKNKIDPLFAEISIRVVEPDELLSAGCSPDLFRNVNTPEELEYAKIQTRRM